MMYTCMRKYMYVYVCCQTLRYVKMSRQLICDDEMRAHVYTCTCTCIYMYMYMYIHVHVHVGIVTS